MAKKSSKKPRANAAKGKPYPEFPLTPHKTGRWRKIHKGKPYYFGPLDDPDAAYERYEREWPYILAGKPIPPAHGGSAEGIITLADVVNAYIESKRNRMGTGELSPRTYADVVRTGKLLVKAIDRNRDIETIGPADFAELRSVLAKGRSLLVLGILIGRCRSVFKYAVDEQMRKSAVHYGQAFDRPKAHTVQKQQASKPARLFTPAECRKLIDAAPTPVKAMVLLGLNAAFGNTDIGGLTMAHIDLDAGIVAMPRVKNGAIRRAALWPQTVEAVSEAIEARPTPDKAAEGLVFVTKYGAPWSRSKIVETAKGDRVTSKLSLTDAVGGEFAKLMKATGLHVKGRAFYALRHTFRTLADDMPDRPAVDLVMGHKPQDMRGHYVTPDSIDDTRVQAVASHVHKKMFNKPTRTPRRKKPGDNSKD